MVNLLTGPKGSGKTQQMIELANNAVKECDGRVFFIKKTHRDTYSLSFNIKTICMDDYPVIKTASEYVGFLYGMASADNDIESVFIDGIFKHADITLDTLPAFVEAVKKVSADCKVDFYISVSASPEELVNVNMEGCKVLN